MTAGSLPNTLREAVFLDRNGTIIEDRWHFVMLSAVVFLRGAVGVADRRNTP